MDGWLVNLNSGFFNQTGFESVFCYLTVIKGNMAVILSVSVLLNVLTIDYVGYFLFQVLFIHRVCVETCFLNMNYMAVREYNTCSLKIISYDSKSESFSVPSKASSEANQLVASFSKCFEIRTNRVLTYIV